MKNGPRFKRGSIRKLFSGPLLRRLNRRERQELAEKSAAAQVAAKVKPAGKERRPAFGLEAVEPRLLMSADFLFNPVTNQTLNLSIGGRRRRRP